MLTITCPRSHSDLSWDLKPGNLIPACMKLNTPFHTSPQDASSIFPFCDSTSSPTPALFSPWCSLSLTSHLNKNGWKVEYIEPSVLNLNPDSTLIFQITPDGPPLEHLGPGQNPSLRWRERPLWWKHVRQPQLCLKAHSTANLSETYLFKTWG